ncbi:type II toxin-antitoxin system VapC family toxin [Beijerinckia sp. L45]|uniref:type II toxin-antitoxin system VapC family toxin n=1 Tax=Beijerinckia sp. L45 TaxID=1641855 RepID=UPI00131DFE7F|nr:type II toxin-antitoxin system VapC family toxin [Beijerinckia sp. L45]
MTAFVVDASIAACWLLPDERHPVAEAAYDLIRTTSAVAPSLWWFELRNMFVINERRGRIDIQKTTEALRVLKALPVTIDMDSEEDVLMRLARYHRLTAYDAAYLELACRRRLPLATLDAALIKAARAEAVPLVGARV